MSDSMDGCEGQSVVFDCVTLDLKKFLGVFFITIMDVPRLPVLFDFPVQVFNPSCGSVGRHSSVGVARVDKDFVSSGFEKGVDPVRSFRLEVVLPVVVMFAGKPALNLGLSLRHVQLSSHFIVVEVIRQRISQDNWLSL